MERIHERKIKYSGHKQVHSLTVIHMQESQINVNVVNVYMK